MSITPTTRSRVGALLCAAAALLGLPLAHAGVVIGGTRVVYDARAPEVTLKLDNRNQHPSLVQVWIDAGDSGIAPDDAEVPFVVMPPVFRMEPGRSQMVRIRQLDPALPADRESLFWINELEVAPKPDAQQGRAVNYMQLAFRTRIKLFYRPAGLAGGPTMTRERIVATLVRDTNTNTNTNTSTSTSTSTHAGGWAVQIHNPTPYHLSFTRLSVESAGQVHLQAQDTGGMVAPMQTGRFALGGQRAPGEGATLLLTVIDDHGASIPLRRPLVR